MEQHWLTIQEFAKQLSGVITVSGLKAMAQRGTIEARKSGSRWLVDVTCPRAQALLAQAHEDQDQDQDQDQEIEKLKRDLATEERLSLRLLKENAELKKQLEIVSAKLEVALALSQPNKPNAPESWTERFAEWSKTQTKPTVSGFATAIGVPRTTVASRLKKEKNK